MLVLSRKSGEELVIGDNVRITVLAVRGNKVKLGIAAPDDVGIRRAELECWSESRTVKGQATDGRMLQPALAAGS